MLLPLFGWAITGFIFFLKPGYQEAYELLAIKTYPIDSDEPINISPKPIWLEVRYLKTILGTHLLVKTFEGWQHLDPITLLPKQTPTENEIKTLVTDAFSLNPNRYGQILSINKQAIVTNTNITISLDWNRLSLQQTGKDTKFIDFLYKIHYLQWTGIKLLDQILGLLGLILIILLSVLGIMLQINTKQK
ncbi:MAG: hypothetical protein IPK14_16245 [Blastocatellia bacterium]|nr:hypothetical protein [Blastocatellia bacterium]MBL8192462.1 hypothetical protein [Blastocatellia bacterium]MBN8724449.1 hypothetical protein [Acidobacteriota bacterium]